MMNNNKFLNKKFTYDGKPRAYVELKNLETLWFNSGTLCNLKCIDCYIESSPFNKSLQYLNLKDIKKYTDEIFFHNLNTKLIGITGGEPFMNPFIMDILAHLLNLNFKVLCLSNGMRPIELKFNRLITLPNLKNLVIRISIDHYEKHDHEKIRGKNTWSKLIKNISWLHNNGFNINIASKIGNSESEDQIRKGFNNLFKKNKINLDAFDKNILVLFPIMNSEKPATEISQECWKILNKNPDNVMCSSSRMIVKKKDEKNTRVLACTLVTKDKNFELGEKLSTSKKKVYLNHPFCSQFCVLGNSSCS